MRTYLALWITITKLVLVPQCKLFGVMLLNLLISELLTHTLRAAGIEKKDNSMEKILFTEKRDTVSS